jgi:hypothetical protein
MPRHIPTYQLLKVCMFLLTSLAVGVASGQFYDGSNMTFGKNRVQYQDFFWMHFPMETFDVYFYPGGRSLAEQVGEILPLARERVESIFDRSLEGPIQVLVYTDYEAFRQSNIGGQISAANNIGGTATLVGTKLFIYGTGNAQDLEQQLQAGLARILFNQILYGGSWQDAVRNNTLITFPSWFTEGLFHFVSDPWSAELAASIYDHARTGAFERIELSGSLPVDELGHGVWKYVVDVFGEPVIANIIYMSRVSKTMEGGFQFATGLNLNDLLAEVSRYHLRSAEPLEELLPAVNTKKNRRLASRDAGALPLRLRLDRNLIAWAPSPDGSRWAIATEERSQIRVEVVDALTGDRRKVGKHGHRIDRSSSGNFPVFAWHPEGDIFAYTLESKGNVQLVTVDLERDEESLRELQNIDCIRSMDFAPNGRQIALSALHNGECDLYLYQLVGNTYRPLWNDQYDDLDVHYSLDGKSLFFTSNRPTSALGEKGERPSPGTSFDVFQVSLDEPLVWTQITQTPSVNERYPRALPEAKITFLAEDAEHQQQRFIAWKDSVVESIDTAIHYRSFIQTRIAETLEAPVIQYDLMPSKGGTVYVHELMGHPYLRFVQDKKHYASPTSDPSDGLPARQWTQDWGWKPGLGEVDFRDFVFGPLGLVEKVEVEEAGTSDAEPTSAGERVTPSMPKPRNYRLNYALESITSQLDNTFSGAFYQSYEGVISAQPGIGGLTRVSMSDLFEDRRFIAGFRLSANLGNSQVGLSYSDLSKRMDRTFSVSRQGQERISSDNRSLVETYIHAFRYQLSYPLDEVRSLRLEAIYRLDVSAYLTIDAFNLALPNVRTNQLGGVLSYVHDASRELDINLRDGTRYKVWAEYYLNTDEAAATFGTIGFDFRHYAPIYKSFLFAFRAAGNWSIGRDRLLHLLGGVDNVLSLTPNANAPIDASVPYAYQTRITPLRGFVNNVRNGSNLALLNAELRLPLVTTFTRKPIPTDFLRHLQAVGFMDCGAAWNGVHPYADENGFNFQTISANPVTVTIDNNHEPILWALGFGLRTRMAGYWLRADWGFGVDDGRWQKRLFNFSFSLDF